jgi:hypothetical protein
MCLYINLQKILKGVVLELSIIEVSLAQKINKNITQASSFLKSKNMFCYFLNFSHVCD